MNTEAEVQACIGTLKNKNLKIIILDALLEKNFHCI